ncbi:hypothetical protein Tco_0342945, partial [Tanacetum coccineum]
NVSPIPTSRIHSSHPSALILGDPTSAVQTRSKKILEALKDESWVDAMQEELLQFEIQKVWILVDLCLLGRRLLAQSGFIKIKRIREELLSETKQG